jgi:hypothetical protein
MATTRYAKSIFPAEKKKIITAQEAAKIAVDYYKEVTGDYNQPGVEEVELAENESNWLITLGFRRSASDTISSLYGKTEVIYKVFEIDAKNGNVLSMKIKKV